MAVDGLGSLVIQTTLVLDSPVQSQAAAPSAQLVRAIGRWSLIALVVNSTIGGGIFGLPSSVAAQTGRSSPLAVLLAGLAIGIIIACFAEVSSRFDSAGGPYLYSRIAFGPAVGLQTAWMLWLAQVAAQAANANVLIAYLGEFWPDATSALTRFLLITVIIGVLASINFYGVKAGTRVNNVFTVAKILPLLAVVGMGLILLPGHRHAAIAAAAIPSGAWFKAVLILFFGIGGFESALAPMSEAKNPRRDAPIALIVGVISCTALYALVVWVVVSTLPDPAHSTRPLAEVARIFSGSTGAALVSIGAVTSVYGILSAKILAMPRVAFALGEQGDLPRVFAAVHSRFRTPYVALFAWTFWAFAVAGRFEWNLTLSAVARLFYYGAICAALPVLRRKQPNQARLRLPAGPVFSSLGVIICLALLSQVDFSQAMILGVTTVLALANWLWARTPARKATP
jgi:APA family basic amino acid/polyamine antiporter